MESQIAYKACVLFIPNLGVSGGVRYDKQEFEVVASSGDGYEQTRWKTDKYVQDKEELDKAKKLKERFRRKFVKLGLYIKAGYVVRTDKRTALDEVVEDIKAEIRSFNRGSVYSRFYFYPVTVYIDQSNSDLMTATSQQLVDLLRGIREMLLQADYRAVRKALKGLNTDNYVGLYAGDVNRKLKVAFDRVREEARALTQAQKEFEEGVRTEAYRADVEAVDVARACFIELLESEPTLSSKDRPDEINIRSAASIEF